MENPWISLDGAEFFHVRSSFQKSTCQSLDTVSTRKLHKKTTMAAMTRVGLIEMGLIRDKKLLQKAPLVLAGTAGDLTVNIF